MLIALAGLAVALCYTLDIVPADDPDGIGLITVTHGGEIVLVDTTDHSEFDVGLPGPKTEDAQCFDVEQIGLSGARATTEVCTELVPKGCATARGAGALAIAGGALGIRRRAC